MACISMSRPDQRIESNDVDYHGNPFVQAKVQYMLCEYIMAIV